MQPIAIVMDDMIDMMLVDTENHAWFWDYAASVKGKNPHVPLLHDGGRIRRGGQPSPGILRESQ